MEHEEQIEIPEVQIPAQEEKPKYRPRPAFQVWAARIGVGIVLIGFILYCLHIAGIGI